MSLCTVQRKFHILRLCHFHPLSTTKLPNCSFNTSTTVASKQTAKYIQKFFSADGNQRKKRVWHSGPQIQSLEGLAKPQGRGEKNNQRIHRLNKVFMDKISDVMASGVVSTQLSGFGLEISKIQVLADMREINVYWISSGREDTDMRVGEILAKNSSNIRRELCQLSVLGRVPLLNFVPDHRYHKMAELERRLATADFGPDFIPTDPSHHLKRELTLKTNLSDHLQKVLSESSNSALDDSEVSPLVEPSSLSPMEHDILGVNTQRIYETVRKQVIKAEGAHRLEQGQQSTTDASDTYIDYDPESVMRRTQEIRLWADQRERAKKKLLRRLKRQKQQLINVPREFQTFDHDIDNDIYNEEDYEDDTNNEKYDYERL